MEKTDDGVIGRDLAGPSGLLMRMAQKFGRETGGTFGFAGRNCRAADIHFRGRPRLAKTTPCESAVQRSWLASLSASFRSGPGGNRRACSNASAARISWSILSDSFCVSLFMMAGCDC